MAKFKGVMTALQLSVAGLYQTEMGLPAVASFNELYETGDETLCFLVSQAGESRDLGDFFTRIQGAEQMISFVKNRLIKESIERENEAFAREEREMAMYNLNSEQRVYINAQVAA
jgi:hypothetical protein